MGRCILTTALVALVLWTGTVRAATSPMFSDYPATWGAFTFYPQRVFLNSAESHITVTGGYNYPAGVFVAKWPVNTTYTPPSPVWKTKIDTTYVSASGSCQDPAGDIYLLGQTVGPATTLDPAQYTVSPSSLQNSFVAKLSGSTGAIMWINDPAAADANDLAVDCGADGSGNLFVVGRADGAVPGGTHGGSWDDYYVKMNAVDGSVSARVQDPISTDETSSRAVIMSTGTFLVVGKGLDGSGQHAVKFRKINPSSMAVLSRVDDVIGPSTNCWIWERPYDMIIDPIDNVYVAISYVGNGPHCFGGQPSWGSSDFAIAKYNSALVRQWAIRPGTINAERQAYLTMHHPSSTLYIIGSTEGVIASGSQGGSDYFVRKVRASTGAIQSTIQFGTGEMDAPGSAAVSSNGTVYIAGAPPFSVPRITPKEDCPSGSEYILSNNENLWSPCKKCDPLHISQSNGTEACTQCAGGYITNEEQTSCVKCPATTFQNGTICSPCPFGRTSGEASVSCVSCPLGKIAVAGGICIPCGVGEYGYVLPDGLSGCAPCPHKSTTLAMGSSMIEHCTCVEGQYGDPLGTNPRNCTACPANSECDGGLYPSAKAGYYLRSTSYDDGSTICVPSMACPGGMESCSSGYDSDQCSRCATGYYRSQQLCKICPQNSIIVLVLTVLAILVVVVLFTGFALLWIFSKHMRKIRRIFVFILKVIPALLRLIALQVAFLQMAQTLFTMGINISFPLKAQMESLFDLASLDIGSIANAECSSGQSLGYLAKYLLKMMIVPGLAVVFVLLGGLGVLVGRISYCCKLRRSKERRHGWCHQGFAVLGVFFSTLNVVYYPVHVMVLDPWRCEETSSGVYVLTSLPEEQCYVSGGVWPVSASTSVVFILFYSVGIPILFGLVVLLFVKKSIRTKTILGATVFHFLVEKFEDKYFYWELAIILKKFLVGFVISMISTGSYDQGALVMIVIGSALVLHCTHRPFKAFREDLLELVSLTCTLLLTYLGLTSKPHAVHGVTTAMSLVLEMVMFVLVVGQGLFFVLIIVLLLRDECRSAASALRDHEHPSHVSKEVSKEPSPFEPLKSSCESSTSPSTIQEESRSSTTRQDSKAVSQEVSQEVSKEFSKGVSSFQPLKLPPEARTAASPATEKPLSSTAHPVPSKPYKDSQNPATLAGSKWARNTRPVVHTSGHPSRSGGAGPAGAGPKRPSQRSRNPAQIRSKLVK